QDRLLYPAVRKGPKGSGTFERVGWTEAMDLIARRMTEIKATRGAEAILPYYYGGSNGLLTQNTNDAELWRRFGTSRLATTICAAPTGAANLALYGKMAGVSYQDSVHARLIILWGVNPSASGIHLIPYVKEAQAAGATLVVIDPRRTSLAKKADLHLAPRPGTDLPVALALHRVLFEEGHADEAFLTRHARGADRLRAAAQPWTIDKAAAEAGRAPAALPPPAGLSAAPPPPPAPAGLGRVRRGAGGEREGGKRRGGGDGAPLGRGQVRRARGRLLDVELARVRAQVVAVDRRAGATDAACEHEPSRPRADGVWRPAGRPAVRLQLQPARDRAGAEPRGAGPAARRPLHGRLRAGLHRHRALR